MARRFSPAYTNLPPSQQGRPGIAPAVSAFAAANQVDPTLLQAVLNVEAGGRTHDAVTGLAIARLEVHQFRDNSGLDPATFNQYFKVGDGDRWFLDAWYRTDPNGEWQNVHANQASEQAAIALAASLTSRATALANTSMGGPQIFGGNAAALGYDDAAAMYDAFTADPQAQYTGYFDYLNVTGLAGHLARRRHRRASSPATTVPPMSPTTAPPCARSKPCWLPAPSPTPLWPWMQTPPRVSLDAFQPDMLPGLTATRIAKLVSNTTFRTVGDIAQLDATRTADDKPGPDAAWLGDQLGASDADAEAIILAAKEWTSPGPTTRPATVAYLFATGNRSEVSGDDLSKAELEAIAKAGARQPAKPGHLEPL